MKIEADLCNGIHLGDNQCIVALDESGTSWIIARSDEYIAKDVMPEISAEDNGFKPLDWDKDLCVGMYLLTTKPWGWKDEMTGEWDAGVDVLKVEPLWTIEALRPDAGFCGPDPEKQLGGVVESIPHAQGCECCGDQSSPGPLFLHAACHIGSPLEAMLEGEVLMLRCYECENEVVRLKVQRV